MAAILAMLSLSPLQPRTVAAKALWPNRPTLCKELANIREYYGYATQCRPGAYVQRLSTISISLCYHSWLLLMLILMLKPDVLHLGLILTSPRVEAHGFSGLFITPVHSRILALYYWIAALMGLVGLPSEVNHLWPFNRSDLCRGFKKYYMTRTALGAPFHYLATSYSLFPSYGVVKQHPWLCLPPLIWLCTLPNWLSSECNLAEIMQYLPYATLV